MISSRHEERFLQTHMHTFVDRTVFKDYFVTELI